MKFLVLLLLTSLNANVLENRIMDCLEKNIENPVSCEKHLRNAPIQERKDWRCRFAFLSIGILPEEAMNDQLDEEELLNVFALSGQEEIQHITDACEEGISEELQNAVQLSIMATKFIQNDFGGSSENYSCSGEENSEDSIYEDLYFLFEGFEEEEGWDAT